MKTLVLFLIIFYQKYLSVPLVCRYSPTCSQYAYESILKYGILKGVFLGAKRILRCHPWAAGGLDPV